MPKQKNIISINDAQSVGLLMMLDSASLVVSVVLTTFHATKNI